MGKITDIGQRKIGKKVLWTNESKFEEFLITQNICVMQNK